MKKRIPVILVGCVDEDIFPGDTEENPKFGGYSFDEILLKLFSNNSFVPRPMIRRKIMKLLNKNDYQLSHKMASKLRNAIKTSKEQPLKASSWTHTGTPNDEKHDIEGILETRAGGHLRSFLKLSTIVSDWECYKNFQDMKSGKLNKGYLQCLILDGLWKPKPIPEDLYTATKYPGDWGWLIFSSENTGRHDFKM